LRELCLEHRDLLHGRLLLRVVLGELRLDLRMRGLEPLPRFGGGGAGVQQPLLPLQIAVALLTCRRRGCDNSLRRLDVGELKLVLRPQRSRLGGRRENVGLGLRDRSLVVIINKVRQDLSPLHALIVLNRELADVTGYLGGDWREIGLQVRIVGSLPALTAFPAIPVRRHHDDDAGGDDEHEAPPADLEDPVPVPLRESLTQARRGLIAAGVVRLHHCNSAFNDECGSTGSRNRLGPIVVRRVVMAILARRAALLPLRASKPS
jgi:hypothetical protein